MLRKWLLSLVLVGLVAVILAPAVAAQTRSIRGTVREDKDGDGKCANGPIVVGVPIEFISNDGKWTHVLYTGSDGTYGLVEVGLGTWTVTAKPSAEWVVTSAKSLKPFVSEPQPVVLNNDFCIRKATAVTSGGTTVLPQSGSFMPTGLAVSLFTGVMFVVTGLVVEGRRRWLNVGQ